MAEISAAAGQTAFACSAWLGLVNVLATFIAILLRRQARPQAVAPAGQSHAGRRIGRCRLVVLLRHGDGRRAAGPGHHLLIAFAMAMGPIPWVLCSEIFPAKLRGRAMSVATFSIWMGCFVIVQTSPALMRLSPAAAFFFYGGMLAGNLPFRALRDSRNEGPVAGRDRTILAQAGHTISLTGDLSMNEPGTDRGLRQASWLPRTSPPIAPCCMAATAIVAWAVVCASAQEHVGRSTVSGRVEGAHGQIVDFRYSPPQWQTAICLPDDPCKSLVDKSGALLYHYGQGGREFGTRIAVEVDRRRRLAETGTALAPRAHRPDLPDRAGRGDRRRGVCRHRPAAARCRTAMLAAHRWRRGEQELGETGGRRGPIAAGHCPAQRRLASLRGASLPPGATRRVALALCEGWWGEPGKRVQVLRVEGAEPKTVDTVADIGKNKAAAFWFDAKDINGDGKIEIVVDAASQAADKNTILNGLWVFPADTQGRQPGPLGRQAERSCPWKPEPGKPGRPGPQRPDPGARQEHRR